MRELAFPLLLLPFMIPIPAVIYNQITFPLQLFASQVAEFSLGLMGIPVLRDGNILELASQKLSVVEACSGIRSLLSLSFLSLVYAYFFDKQGVDALGSAGRDHSDCDSGERGPRDHHRHPE